MVWIWMQDFFKLKDSSTLQDRTFFHNLAHISGKTDRILMKILSEITLDKVVPMIF